MTVTAHPSRSTPSPTRRWFVLRPFGAWGSWGILLPRAEARGYIPVRLRRGRCGSPRPKRPAQKASASRPNPKLGGTARSVPRQRPRRDATRTSSSRLNLRIDGTETSLSRLNPEVGGTEASMSRLTLKVGGTKSPASRLNLKVGGTKSPASRLNLKVSVTPTTSSHLLPVTSVTLTIWSRLFPEVNVTTRDLTNSWQLVPGVDAFCVNGLGTWRSPSAAQSLTSRTRREGCGRKAFSGTAADRTCARCYPPVPDRRARSPPGRRSGSTGVSAARGGS